MPSADHVGLRKVTKDSSPGAVIGSTSLSFSSFPPAAQSSNCRCWSRPGTELDHQEVYYEYTWYTLPPDILTGLDHTNELQGLCCNNSERSMNPWNQPADAAAFQAR